MSEYMEFEGKSIDLAIDLACEHFNEDREKLEIEILHDAKPGLFGIVGGRKARVRARLLDGDAELKSLVSSIVTRIVEPIIGDFQMSVAVEEDRVRVSVEAGEAAGLLIGREGQTLASVQYLAGRVLAKRWPQPLRLHVDIGDYRERQEETLVQTALELADKAKSQRRTQSTRPLSSYHRRLVHLALQDDAEISTRSKGDGAMKRVLILPRNGRSGGNDSGRSGSGKGGTGRNSRGSRGGRGRRPRPRPDTDRND